MIFQTPQTYPGSKICQQVDDFHIDQVSLNTRWQIEMSLEDLCWGCGVGGVVLLGPVGYRISEMLRILKGANSAGGWKEPICFHFFSKHLSSYWMQYYEIYYILCVIHHWHALTLLHYKLFYNWEVSFESGWRWSDTHAAQMQNRTDWTLALSWDQSAMHGVSRGWCYEMIFNWTDFICNKIGFLHHEESGWKWVICWVWRQKPYGVCVKIRDPQKIIKNLYGSGSFVSSRKPIDFNLPSFETRPYLMEWQGNRQLSVSLLCFFFYRESLEAGSCWTKHVPILVWLQLLFFLVVHDRE